MRNTRREPAEVRAPASVLSYDIETVAPAMPDGSFPPWATHQPIAIGFAQARRLSGEWSFDIAGLVVGGETGETALLREADRRLDQVEVAVTLNGRGFDSLVLRLAAQRCRLWDLNALAVHATTPRFDGAHADLADLYSSFGRKVGLVDLCAAIGIPAKTDISGGDVAALWQAGETERIRSYVIEDSVANLCLHFAWSAARSADEAQVSRPMAALARHIEATPGLHHLQPFMECSLMRWCRPRAMRADIAAALERVTARLKREEEARDFV